MSIAYFINLPDKEILCRYRLLGHSLIYYYNSNKNNNVLLLMMIIISIIVLITINILILLPGQLDATRVQIGHIL